MSWPCAHMHKECAAAEDNGSDDVGVAHNDEAAESRLLALFKRLQTTHVKALMKAHKREQEKHCQPMGDKAAELAATEASLADAENTLEKLRSVVRGGAASDGCRIVHLQQCSTHAATSSNSVGR
jgi:hypothetical protein